MLPPLKDDCFVIKEKKEKVLENEEGKVCLESKWKKSCKS